MSDATVFIVDDDASVRDSLALLLSLRGFRTQSFASAEAFLDTYRGDREGCLLTDLRMPGLSGLELHAELQRRGVALPVVVLTAHGDVATTRMAMKAGAFDFLEKPVDDAVLLDVLHHAIAEDGRRREAARREQSVRERLDRLTPREADVLRLLVEGLQHRDVAERLSISPRTVEVYKARMMEKLQCRSIAELVRVAVASGLVAGDSGNPRTGQPEWQGP